MNNRKITETLWVGAQLTPEEVAEARAAGFAAIISARPDGEDADQPAFADVARAAEVAGLPIRHIPVVPGQATEADVRAFAEAVRALPHPVLAYCRSGGRAEKLWQEAERIGA